MDIPLQISLHKMDPSPAVEEHVRQEMEKLELFCNFIISGRVVVDSPHRKGHKGNLYQVRIDLKTPGHELVVNRSGNRDHAHEDVHVAIRDAFKAMTRQLEDQVRKTRGKVKVHEAPPHGRVVRLFPEEGYGFVETSDGYEVYFHENSVTDAKFETLEVGTEVRISIAHDESEHGPQATTVMPIGKHHLIE